MRLDKNSLYFKVHQLLKCGDVDVYVDMDGVLAEYKYGEGSKILNGDTSVYSQKRPIKTIIKFIRKYYKDITIIPVPKSISKTKMVHTKDSILIDDYSGNLREWEKEGGISVRFSLELESKGFKVIDRLDQIIDMF